MAMGGKSRRAFLTESASGIGAAWLAANWQAIVEAQEFVQHGGRVGSAARNSRSSRRSRRPRSRPWPRRSSRPTTRRARAKRTSSSSSTARSTTFERDRQADYIKGLDELARADQAARPEREPFSALLGRRQDPAADRDREDAVLRPRSHAHDHRASSRPGARRQPNKVGWTLVSYDDSLEPQAAVRLLRRAARVHQPLSAALERRHGDNSHQPPKSTSSSSGRAPPAASWPSSYRRPASPSSCSNRAAGASTATNRSTPKTSR